MKIYKTLRYLEKRSTVPLIGVCLYEATALLFPNEFTPPLTKVLSRHKWIFPVFVAGLGAHIWAYERSDG